MVKSLGSENEEVKGGKRGKYTYDFLSKMDI